jgi:multidrug resistance efflux pump
MAAKNPDEDTAGRRQTLAAVIVVALLLLGGWWLMSTLQGHRDTEDCVASGRRDCVQLVPEK